MMERYTATQRHTIQVDFIPFLDELAELLGCKPDISECLFPLHCWHELSSINNDSFPSSEHLLLTDPALALKVFFGPSTPYQYRLMGPGAWSGARAAIMSQWDRVYHPLRETRKVVTEDEGYSKIIIMIVLAVVVAWLIGLL